MAGCQSKELNLYFHKPDGTDRYTMCSVYQDAMKRDEHIPMHYTVRKILQDENFELSYEDLLTRAVKKMDRKAFASMGPLARERTVWFMNMQLRQREMLGHVNMQCPSIELDEELEVYRTRRWVREVNRFGRNARIYANEHLHDNLMIMKHFRKNCLNTLSVLPNMDRCRELRRRFNNIEEELFNIIGPSRDVMGICEYDRMELGWFIVCYEELAVNIDRFIINAHIQGYIEEEETKKWRRMINVRDSSIQTYDDEDDIVDSEDEEGYTDGNERPHVEIRDLMTAMMSDVVDECFMMPSTPPKDWPEMEDEEEEEEEEGMDDSQIGEISSQMEEVNLRQHYIAPLLTQDQHQEMVATPSETENNDENDPLMQSFINSNDEDDILLNMIM